MMGFQEESPMWLRSFAGLTALLALALPATAAELERVRIADDGRGFVLADSGRPFFVWGLNYDHDAAGRLIEDYWNDEWPVIEQDFGEMKELGANVIRVHLQFGRFMTTPEEPNEAAMEQLGHLVELAEQTGLYLDVTGLGCYHKRDVPAWYDKLPEQERWAAQGRFWEAIAKTCASSGAIFCYDLMNEPVVAAGPPRDDWLGPPFAGKHFVQFITLDLAGRDRTEVARQWIGTLVAAIRKHDRRHLVSVGLVPWSLDRPGLTSGFVPEKIAGELDFVAAHIYPESRKLDEAIETIKGFAAAGKPVLVEETFPLKCSPAQLEHVMDGTRDQVSGWVGFYWGETEEKCRRKGTISGGMTAGWLEMFRNKAGS
jgi:Cellulase (glycosyl hydrolase family 5)